MALRQQRRESHWARKPPTPDEVLLIHDLIRNHHLHRTAAHHHHHSQAGAVAMARTVLHSSHLMHRYAVLKGVDCVRQPWGPGILRKALGTSRKLPSVPSKPGNRRVALVASLTWLPGHHADGRYQSNVQMLADSRRMYVPRPACPLSPFPARPAPAARTATPPAPPLTFLPPQPGPQRLERHLRGPPAAPGLRARFRHGRAARRWDAGRSVRSHSVVCAHKEMRRATPCRPTGRAGAADNPSLGPNPSRDSYRVLLSYLSLGMAPL